MKSNATTVDAFLAEQPEAIRQQLMALRTLIKEVAPHAEEQMNYGMPYYAVKGAQLCAFNAQKNYLAFYVGNVTDDFKTQLTGFSFGKGCVRFKQANEHHLQVLKELFRHSMAKKFAL